MGTDDERKQYDIMRHMFGAYSPHIFNKSEAEEFIKGNIASRITDSRLLKIVTVEDYKVRLAELKLRKV